MTVRSKAFGPTTTTANAETTIGNTYTLPAGTRKLVGLLVGLNADTLADEGGAAIVKIVADFASGPFEFVVSHGGVGTTSGTHPISTPRIIPLDIDVPGAGQITVSAITVSAVKIAVSVMFS